MFDLPLCNARLFEEGLSIHTYETILPRTKFNHYAELITSLGPRSRRVRIFQTFRFLLLFNFFPSRDVFSIEKKVTGGVVVEFTVEVGFAQNERLIGTLMSGE